MLGYVLEGSYKGCGFYRLEGKQGMYLLLEDGSRLFLNRSAVAKLAPLGEKKQILIT